jgi:hypothetical protein
MSGRVDPDAAPGALQGSAVAALLATLPPPPVALDPDIEVGNQLPPEHPAWSKDTLSVSMRARALLARIRPVVVKVLTFWDHRVRSIFVGGRALSVDASGSYRLD